MPLPYSTRLGRAIRPVTLQDIATRAGVSYSLVTKIATGKRRCNDAVARAVRDLLGVEPSELFPEP